MGNLVEDIGSASTWISEALRSSGYSADFSPESRWPWALYGQATRRGGYTAALVEILVRTPPTAVEIDALSKDERLQLIERLWESLDQPDDVAVTSEQRRELRRREEALDAGELRTLPVDDVLAAIRSRRVPR